MKSILVIGLGRFGNHLLHKFYDLGDEVMAVDVNEEKVQAAMPYATSAKIGDCTKMDTLRSLGVKNFDICFVCIGEGFQNSLEITSLLHEMGAKRVISKANTEIHAKFLLRNGADEVTYPERDSAQKLATRCSVDNIFDFIELTKDTAIYEIPILESWVKNGTSIQALPGAEYVFNPDDHIIILGQNADVEKLLKKMD